MLKPNSSCNSIAAQGTLPVAEACLRLEHCGKGNSMSLLIVQKDLHTWHCACIPLQCMPVYEGLQTWLVIVHWVGDRLSGLC